MYAKTQNHYKDDDDGPVRISNEGFGERFLQLVAAPRILLEDQHTE